MIKGTESSAGDNEANAAQVLDGKFSLCEANMWQTEAGKNGKRSNDSGERPERGRREAGETVVDLPRNSPNNISHTPASALTA